MPEHDWLVETEYTALRQEIASSLSSIHQLELATLGGIGALVAWLATHPTTPRYSWWLPLLLTFAAALRAAGTYRSVALIAKYLRAKEAEAAATAIRWETWRGAHSSGLLLSITLFWLTLMGLSLVIGVGGGSEFAMSSKSASGIALKCAVAPTSEAGVALRCVPRPGE